MTIAYLKVHADKNTAAKRIVAVTAQHRLLAVTTHYFDDNEREKRACIAQIKAHLICAGYCVDTSEVEP